jgi:fucose permease
MLAVGILTWLLYLMIPEEEAKPQKGGKNKGRVDYGFTKEPMFYLVILTLFFYLCAEQGVIGWMITYFKDTGYLSPSVSQITASVQWVMMLVGRLSVAWLSTKVDKEKLLPAMGVGIVIFFILLIMSRSTVPIMIGIVGFGLSMAGIYPTTVSFSGGIIDKYPMAWSYILTIASLGSIIMPSIIGKIAETAGIAVGMSSVALVVAVDMIFILILCAYSTKKKKLEVN